MPKWSVHHGDCLEVMRTLAESSIDAVVTDPPYGLEFMGKEWDRLDGDAWRAGAGFSKPGIGERRTQWPSFGSGDTANASCLTCGGRMRGARRCRCEHPDYRVKGKPIGDDKIDSRQAQGAKMQQWHHLWAAEALRVCKPGAHLLAFGGTRTYHRLVCAVEDAGWEIRDQIGWAFGSGFPKSLNLDGEWDGWGTALKPAWEPIVLARKPLVGTVAENMEKHSTGALNIDGCRVPFAGCDDKEQAKPQGRATTKANGAAAATPDAGRGIERIDFPIKQSDRGRWPANLLHDGSPEVLACFPQTASGKMRPTHTTASRAVYGPNADGGYTTMETYGDAGSAARFFYVPKADREDRDSGLADRTNSHPTVKPTDLMRYLCRLITPPGGVVLDPFAGSGSTGRGASIEGFGFVGIEREAEYVEIARCRIKEAAGLFSQEHA